MVTEILDKVGRRVEQPDTRVRDQRDRERPWRAHTEERVEPSFELGNAAHAAV